MVIYFDLKSKLKYNINIKNMCYLKGEVTKGGTWKRQPAMWAGQWPSLVCKADR